MKILHLCLGSFYPDNYSYQENMLPKFHKKLGYEVEVIASLVTFDENGNGTYSTNIGSYYNEYGIKVTRLDYKKPTFLYHKFKRYKKTYETINSANPDIIFIHGCQFLDTSEVIKYLKKHPNVVTYVDNHVDFSNSARNWLSRNILHKIIWKRCAQNLNLYVKKFYGVLPARVDFMTDIYKLPKEKVELLVMGADDDKIIEAEKENSREKLRKKYNIDDNDFLIITGGKIDKFKTQTLLLMQAVKNIKDKKVKLIIFGSVIPELKEKINNLCDGIKIQYIGWIQSEESYKYLSAADLVVFPGRHSVFWEQVAGMGIPMLCKRWDGTTHIDIGGNVIFLEYDSIKEMQDKVEYLIKNPDKYKDMLNAAKGKGKEKFSYKEIAKRAIK